MIISQTTLSMPILKSLVVLAILPKQEYRECSIDRLILQNPYDKCSKIAATYTDCMIQYWLPCGLQTTWQYMNAQDISATTYRVCNTVQSLYDGEIIVID